MDLSLNLDPVILFGNFLFSLIGIAVWRYGRKTESPRHIVLALALMIFPYFFESAWGLYLTGTVLSILTIWPHF